MPPTGLAASRPSPCARSPRALAPSSRPCCAALGDLLVVVLTQVVGRAIGLVGPRHFCRAWAAHQQALNDSRPWLSGGLRRPSGGERRPGRPQWLPFPSGLPGARAPCVLSPFSSQRLAPAGWPGSGLLLLAAPAGRCAAGGRRPHSRQQLRRPTSTPSMPATAPWAAPQQAWSQAGWLITAPPGVYYLD